LIPVHELASRLNEIEKYKDKTIILYCRSGNRSGKATTLLNNAGFDAINLLGGMNQWKGPVHKK
jgi:adenylyltransferase/sulfurtransferase